MTATFVLILAHLLAPGQTVGVTDSFEVEAWIKDGPRRRFSTRIVRHLKDFDPTARESLDVYGGWKTRRHEATGFFYAKKIDGRWWLIDPMGYRFLHVAVNSVAPGDSPTNRERLARRFGSPQRWRDETVSLLRQHGFNGVGNWSDDELLRTAASPLVWTPRLNFMGSYGQKTRRVVQEPGHLGYPNRCIFVFDPEFEEHAEEVARHAAKYKDDPYVLGYFSDNELPFPKDLLDRYLQLPPTDPGHQAAENWLMARHTLRSQIDDNLRESFRGHVVDRYLSICRQAIRRYDPNHLFLGPRFYGSERGSEAVLRAAGRNLDVIAVNLYGMWTPDVDVLRQWSDWADRPLLITEWYAKGADSGMDNLTGAGWTVATQQDRGHFYQNFALTLLESRVCVGWHWFKYMDNDPRDLTTDPSNRNSNKGIVTAAYEPWQPLLDAMRELNNSLYPFTKRFDESNEEAPRR